MADYNVELREKEGTTFSNIRYYLRAHWDNLDGKPSSYNPASHDHSISEVINLQSNLDAKVPTSRTVNGKALSSNITLTASDVSAVPTSRTVNGKALSSNISLTASDVGAMATSHDAAAVTSAKIITWDTAASWGNHAGVGYLTAVPNDHVTNARLANMATARIKGRVTAGTGDPEDLTQAQVRTFLGLGTAAYTATSAYRSSSWVPSWSDINNPPTTFTPSTHTHGQITNDGKIGSAASKLVITQTGGEVGVMPAPSEESALYITAAGNVGVMDYVTLRASIGAEPAFSAGNSAQYRRGDKTWQTLNASAVGLGNVANAAQVRTDSTGQTVAGNKNFSGQLQHTMGTISGTSITVNFLSSNVQTHSITANTSYTNAASNKAAGRSITIRIVNTSGATRNLTFNSNWKFIGTKPSSIANNKVGVLSLTCFGSNETDVVAAWAGEA